MIPKGTFEKMFNYAENLLSIKDGVTKAASNDNGIRTVKNVNSSSRKMFPQMQKLSVV